MYNQVMATTTETKIAVAKETCDYWGTTKGRRMVVKKEYFDNGEFHLRGKWEDDGAPVDLPSVFFDCLWYEKI